jgi:hypothetical protein
MDAPELGQPWTAAAAILMSVSNVALSHLAIADLAIVLPDFVAELRGQHR